MIVIDRAIRILAGFFILLFWGLIEPTWWCFVGLIPLVTGVSGISLVYLIRGEYSKNKKSKKPKTAEELQKEKLTKEARKQKREEMFAAMKSKAIEAQNYRKKAWEEAQAIDEQNRPTNEEIFSQINNKLNRASKPSKKGRKNALFDDKPIFKE